MRQPAKGLRVTSDAVLLAAAVPNEATGTLLDIGSGSGILALSIAKRAKGITALGLDIQNDLVELARENAEMNGLSERVDFQYADVTEKGLLKGVAFDYVITNPPFYNESPLKTPVAKAIAHHEKTEDLLSAWVDFALRHLKPKGQFIMLHKTERLPEILPLLSKKLGGLTVRPLYSRIGDSSTRIIVSGVLNSKKPFCLLPPLTIHESDGSFSKEANDILSGRFSQN